jgi:hypothetical protein
MRALLYVFAIGFVAAVLFASVDHLEPNRRLAALLKILILALSAAVVTRHLLP